ncbi:fibronectin type 3 domain-containing protein [Aureococcus anophagefferens]|nr:fibronectin type 3 domain-containing protein [Aureococcus anophagefferens]
MLHWEPVDARLSYPVDAYEVEVMSLQERHLGWRSLDDAVETVKPRNEVQTINIRVDKGSTVAGGYFQIYAAFYGISPLNTDAAAIEGLENVDALVHVIRCDGVLGSGGVGGWVGGCPFGAYGAYSWHVEFDTPRTEATAYDGALREFNQPTLDLRTQTMSAPMPSAGFGSIPVLGIYKETVSLGVSWTGPGPAVSVWRAGSSLPCGAAEWRTSPKHPALPRGSAVFYASTPPNAAQQAAASAPPAATYELQYRQDEAAPWVDAPAPIDVDGSGWATATLYGLEAGAAVFAVARDAAGASPWSLSSNGGVATRDPKPPVPSAPVATLDGGDGAILVRFLPFAADGLGSRSATVARHFELGTQAWKGRGFAAPVGWDVAYDRPLPYVLTDAVDEIQLATSRCDAGAISGGTFRLRLPVRGAYERGTVTGDLPFDASAFAVKKALEALDVVPEGSLAVTRTPGALESHAPARGAFAWKPENVDLSCAYSGDGVGVVVERLQVGSLETYRDALDAEVFNGARGVFYAAGRPQTYVVPGGSRAAGAKRLVAKLWGGGGGGAGAGRGEANATSRATEALVDDLRLDKTIAVDVGGSDARDLSGPHARHRHVDLGEAPGADYSAVAAGGGGSQGAGGDPGRRGPSNAVSLAWPPNDAATYFWAERYHVEMAEGDVGGFKLVAVRAAADGGVDVAGLDSDAAYRFRLRGANQTATMGAQTGLGADDAASESAAGRAADAPTEFYPSAPSGRQGHSLTRLGGAPEIRAYRLPSAELGAVFLFGGHGDGYECDGAGGATFRLGARVPARLRQRALRAAHGRLRRALAPGRGFTGMGADPAGPQRVVAAAAEPPVAAAGGFVAVFGGVKEPDPRYVEDGDLEFAYYRDLWLLDVGAPRRGTWSWTAGSAVDPVFVPDARTTYFDVNVTAGDEWCLRDVDIYVRISHPCASQLSISVVGPGP